jgi:hypothetical protein
MLGKRSLLALSILAVLAFNVESNGFGGGNGGFGGLTGGQFGGGLGRKDRGDLEKFISDKLEKANSTLREKIVDLINRNVTRKIPKADEGDDDNTARKERSKAKDILLAGKSGVIKIAAGGRFTFVKLRKLVDSDGQTAKNFEDADWTWSSAQQVTLSGLSAKNFSAKLSTQVASKQVSVELNGMIFSQNGTIPYGDGTVDVYEGSVKISYLISNWPFKYDNSTLFLAVTVGSSGRGVNNSRSVGENGEDRPKISVGDGFFDTPTYALHDNLTLPIKVRFLVDSDSDSGSQAGVIFEFNKFNTSLYYDPVSVLGSCLPNNAASITPVSSLLFTAAVAVILAAFF